MDRGDWQAIVHGVTELDMTQHACPNACIGQGSTEKHEKVRERKRVERREIFRNWLMQL